MVKDVYPYVPIIAKAGDDIKMLFFSNLSIAERHLEIYDVENNFWTVFDARGKLLTPVVKFETVRILVDDTEPKHIVELEQFLRTFLISKGDVWYEHAGDMQLAELVKLCDKYIRTD